MEICFLCKMLTEIYHFLLFWISTRTFDLLKILSWRARRQIIFYTLAFLYMNSLHNLADYSFKMKMFDLLQTLH